jgi:hypothetical protein
MATRKPLVIVSGQVQELAAGDTFDKASVGLANVADAAAVPLDTAGPLPGQLPTNQHLGALAFMDEMGVLTPMAYQPTDLRAVWFEYVSDTSLKLCMRGSDGVVRSITHTLA